MAAAEWQPAEHTGAGAEWLSVATTALAALLRAKIAQLAVSAVQVAARVRWLTWAMAKEITSRRLHTSTSAVAAILLDPAETSLA
jgi:hypothetical protein